MKRKNSVCSKSLIFNTDRGGSNLIKELGWLIVFQEVKKANMVYNIQLKINYLLMFLMYILEFRGYCTRKGNGYNFFKVKMLKLQKQLFVV